MRGGDSEEVQELLFRADGWGVMLSTNRLKTHVRDFANLCPVSGRHSALSSTDPLQDKNSWLF